MPSTSELFHTALSQISSAFSHIEQRVSQYIEEHPTESIVALRSLALSAGTTSLFGLFSDISNNAPLETLVISVANVVGCYYSACFLNTLENEIAPSL